MREQLSALLDQCLGRSMLKQEVMGTLPLLAGFPGTQSQVSGTSANWEVHLSTRRTSGQETKIADAGATQ